MTIKKFNIGGVEVLGTEEDFRETGPIKIRPQYEGKNEKRKRRVRRARATRPVEKIYNRYHRMRSYWFDKGYDFRITEAEYRELWDTAPDIVTPEGETINAANYVARHGLGKVRAAILNKQNRIIDRSNIGLKLGSKVIHTL